MVRHDIQEDIRNAYQAVKMASTYSTQSGALVHLMQAHDAIKNIAEKFGVDLHYGEID